MLVFGQSETFGHPGTRLATDFAGGNHGGILVNANGERFTNEMGTRDAVSAAELKQPDG